MDFYSFLDDEDDDDEVKQPVKESEPIIDRFKRWTNIFSKQPTPQQTKLLNAK